MLRFEASVDGLPFFDRAFNRVAAGVSDLRPVWPYVTDEWFYLMEQRLFRSQGSSGAHGKWAENQPAYEEYKAKKYGSFTFPLYRTGDLEKSLGGKNRPHAVHEPEAQSLTLGTDLPYAGYHMKPYKGRPARRPIDPTEDDKRELMKTIQKGLLNEIVRPAGFGVPSGIEFLG